VKIARPHPDAERATRRMPFEQLRALVVSLVEAEPDAAPGAAAAPAPRPPRPATGSASGPAPRPPPSITEAVAEFETKPTICLPGPRTSTLDQLVAALRRPDTLARPPALPRRRAPRR
jgi:hypothetical protein